MSEAVPPSVVPEHHGRHAAPVPPPEPVGFWADLRDAVAPRTVVLVLGVLALQVAFIVSYVGAFHAPRPHAISLAVAAPAQVSGRTVAQLDALPSRPLDATAVAGAAAARRAVVRGDSSAALVVDPAGTADTLLVASAGGASVVTAVEAVVTPVEQAQGRTATVQDVVPLQPGDARGLTGFYLVIGWIVGGYLLASLLGVAKGARPATPRRAVFRLAAMVPYAVASGLLGAMVVGPVLGALDGHYWAVAGIGMLLVLSAATVTMAFQVLFGVIGIGITVLVFVVLGNPSAGGAYQGPVLPPFWRVIGPALPNGAGTDAVRRVVYYAAHGATGPVLLVAAYVVAGAAVALAGSVLHHRRAGSAAVTAPLGGA
jgi:hypothetical protein